MKLVKLILTILAQYIHYIISTWGTNFQVLGAMCNMGCCSRLCRYRMRRRVVNTPWGIPTVKNGEQRTLIWRFLDLILFMSGEQHLTSTSWELRLNHMKHSRSSRRENLIHWPWPCSQDQFLFWERTSLQVAGEPSQWPLYLRLAGVLTNHILINTVQYGSIPVRISVHI